LAGIDRKRAIRRIRRRRRRRQRFKRMLPYIALGAVIIAAVACLVSAASSPGEETAAEPAVKFGKQRPAETQPAKVPETTQEAQEAEEVDEAYILTKIAMAEAEGEDTEGKALVILTVLNRVKAPQFPGTIVEVIAQRNAFSSYGNGRYDRVEPDADCRAALELVEGGWDGSQGALYFERTPEDGESTWHSRNLEKLFIHGNHTFYKEKEASE
jgi:spore germination cell wall hydrolase CwlJ-like protein